MTGWAAGTDKAGGRGGHCSVGVVGRARGKGGGDGGTSTTAGDGGTGTAGMGGGIDHLTGTAGSCYNTVWTPTLCKPDTSDRPLFVFSSTYLI
jgi:hypothetical protein